MSNLNENWANFTRTEKPLDERKSRSYESQQWFSCLVFWGFNHISSPLVSNGDSLGVITLISKPQRLCDGSFTLYLQSIEANILIMLEKCQQLAEFYAFSSLGLVLKALFVVLRQSRE